MERASFVVVGLAMLAFAATPGAPCAQDRAATRDSPRDSLGADWAPQQDQARQGVRAGRYLPLARIVAIVAHRTPGRLLDAGIEDDGQGRQVYRVRWSSTAGRRLDVIVDAASGQVLREEGR